MVVVDGVEGLGYIYCYRNSAVDRVALIEAYRDLGGER
jgi:hypothetical protein